MSRMKPTNDIEGVVKASIFVCGGHWLVLSNRSHSNEYMTRVGSEFAIRTTKDRKEEQPGGTPYMKSAGNKERVAKGLAFMGTTEITVTVFK